jgi:hypothetical protein
MPTYPVRVSVAIKKDMATSRIPIDSYAYQPVHQFTVEKRPFGKKGRPNCGPRSMGMGESRAAF